MLETKSGRIVRTWLNDTRSTDYVSLGYRLFVELMI